MPLGESFFETVVHLNDFSIEIGTKNLGGFAGEPEEGVYTDTEVWREDNGNFSAQAWMRARAASS